MCNPGTLGNIWSPPHDTHDFSWLPLVRSRRVLEEFQHLRLQHPPHQLPHSRMEWLQSLTLLKQLALWEGHQWDQWDLWYLKAVSPWMNWRHNNNNSPIVWKELLLKSWCCCVQFAVVLISWERKKVLVLWEKRRRWGCFLSTGKHTTSIVSVDTYFTSPPKSCFFRLWNMWQFSWTSGTVHDSIMHDPSDWPLQTTYLATLDHVLRVFRPPTGSPGFT